ncbi:Crotonobetainyl-CoA:carnitine CoA-transferase CaiB [Variovorax sp. OK605]|uniref:CaiB/BaiF CoA transferase family protein n=1 Tax=Variovorax sp. OK605 TaxID=1855317 RepID=UPI0008E5F614|nr:CoA transferase [Variovorax sp. OK605]SFQ53013.1 Crotonobetainyl-CoA:carnitine CoA-transferase CaiB [Variovorax sp. OK605]
MNSDSNSSNSSNSGDTKAKARPGILDGVRVLDFTAMMSGPYCTRLMADLGAEVIKVEPPEGDHIRMRPPRREGRSTYFAQLNAGKKSLSLDLKKPDAIALVREMVAQCDVLVENYRPGVMKRLGLDYEALCALNPKLVYCSISGFGQEGAWSGRSAYAPVLHAASGYDMANLDYQEGDVERPLKNGIFVADVLGGSLAFGAIQSALFRAARTGEGDHVDLSLMDAMLGLLVYECQEAQFPAERRRPLYRPTKAKDGFLLIAPVSQNNFEALARGTGHPEWITDARFRTSQEREHHWGELMQLLDDWAASRTAAECEAEMNAAGVPCSRYFTVREAMQLPPLVERQAFQTIDDGSGAFQVPNPAFRFSRTAAHARGGVPALGGDGPALLGELLGLSAERIDALRESRTLHVNG